MARLLIIEDDIDLAELLRDVLSDAGHEVMAVSNGAHGLRLLQGHAPTFDLVVTDILMPERDGLEVLWELQAINPSPKVIAISGAPPRWMVLTTATELGADRTLTKPFTCREILQAVTDVLAAN